MATKTVSCSCTCVCSVVSDSLQPHGLQSTKLLYPPGATVHGISQARILEWVGISYSSSTEWINSNFAGEKLLKGLLNWITNVSNTYTHSVFCKKSSPLWMTLIICLCEKNRVHSQKIESEVAQSCPTLCDPMYCSLPGSSIHGIFQARILDCVAISFSRGSSWPRDQIRVSHTADRLFTIWAIRKTHTVPSQFKYCRTSCMCAE